jgi:transcriptional regulator with XRE-family HTH domain
VIFMKRFSPKKLLKRRKRTGMTQRALSNESGISTVSVWAIERGRKDPRAGTLAKLAHAFGYSVEYFFA